MGGSPESLPTLEGAWAEGKRQEVTRSEVFSLLPFGPRSHPQVRQRLRGYCRGDWEQDSDPGEDLFCELPAPLQSGGGAAGMGG